MITVFTPSFADENNTNAQNLTVKEVAARMDPSRFRVVMLAEDTVDPRIAARPNTRILRWRRHGNTVRYLWHLLAHTPDVYFFPREGPLDAAFLSLRAEFCKKTALVTYVVSGDTNRALLQRAVREGDVVAANSRFMAEAVERLGAKEVQTVYDGIDRRYYYPATELPLRSEDGGGSPRVLFAGSFRKYKRADLVVREAAKHPQWEFRLAGSGEERGACEQLAKDMRCGNVVFLGHLDANQLGSEMRAARTFFFPSELEGHPQVLGQVAACGLPCVARSSYRPDYVVDGVTGLLGSSENEMSEALSRLMGQSDLRRRMSRAAIEHATKFDWDGITKQWQEILERAILNRQRARRCSA